MIDAPQIVQAPARPAAVIHLTIPRSEIQAVMGPAFGEVRAALAAQSVVPAGPWFSHHLRRPSDTFDFEVGVPVAAPVAAVGRVRPGQLPAATVARTVYRGDYGGLGAAWGELLAWAAANGHAAAIDLWESYAAGPESSPDPAAWRTELNLPLASE
ncbi:MAG: transcriptional regulator, effector-binding domain/component [Phycisphaerales bacterium]|nr:transcriptional regulator, effector-binding domain/component [Phycisphaerales bacterium]